jgi:hypothetical protein
MSNVRTFLPDATTEKVIVTRGTTFKIELSPAEVAKAVEIIGIALSMTKLESVPDHISHSPFVVRFFADYGHALERDDISGSIPFRATEGDELIVTLNDALAMAINERTVVRAPRGTGHSIAGDDTYTF